MRVKKDPYISSLTLSCLISYRVTGHLRHEQGKSRNAAVHSNDPVSTASDEILTTCTAAGQRSVEWNGDRLTWTEGRAEGLVSHSVLFHVLDRSRAVRV